MKKTLSLALLLLALVACTGRSSKVENNSSTAAIENTEADNVDEIVAEETSSSNSEVMPDPNAQQEQVDEIINASSNAAPPVVETSNVATDKPTGQVEKRIYEVKKDETLMLISFKIYGDYSRWKELRDLNKKKLINGLLVKNGSQIEYMTDGTEFAWQPRGNPHLIKSGDTLGIISKEYYGTLKKWRDLWENNKPMIKDPNKIYAGFTLYYMPGDKNVALQ